MKKKLQEYDDLKRELKENRYDDRIKNQRK